MYYLYGMRLRGFSIGCQPMNGLVDWCDCDGQYYSQLIYDRKLMEEEVEMYSLDLLTEIEDINKEWRY